MYEHEVKWNGNRSGAHGSPFAVNLADYSKNGGSLNQVTPIALIAARLCLHKYSEVV